MQNTPENKFPDDEEPEIPDPGKAEEDMRALQEEQEKARKARGKESFNETVKRGKQMHADEQHNQAYGYHSTEEAKEAEVEAMLETITDLTAMERGNAVEFEVDDNGNKIIGKDARPRQAPTQGTARSHESDAPASNTGGGEQQVGNSRTKRAELIERLQGYGVPIVERTVNKRVREALDMGSVDNIRQVMKRISDDCLDYADERINPEIIETGDDNQVYDEFMNWLDRQDTYIPYFLYNKYVEHEPVLDRYDMFKDDMRDVNVFYLKKGEDEPKQITRDELKEILMKEYPGIKQKIIDTMNQQCPDFHFEERMRLREVMHSIKGAGRKVVVPVDPADKSKGDLHILYNGSNGGNLQMRIETKEKNENGKDVYKKRSLRIDEAAKMIKEDPRLIVNIEKVMKNNRSDKKGGPDEQQKGAKSRDSRTEEPGR